MHRRVPLVLIAVATLTLGAGCSSSDHKGSAAPRSSDSASPAATSSPATGATPTSRPSASGSPAAAATGGPSSGPSSAATSGPHATTAPGKPAASKATAPGTYTYDSSGTQTISGSKQDVSGSSTLTVSPVIDGSQTSTLHNSQGDTEQDLAVRSTGSYLASLTVSSPAVNKEFQFAPPALLFPDPAKVGATWSWHSTSTDGTTTVTASNKVLRTESLTIGGQKVATVVLQTHLVITSKDVTYTADSTNWVVPAYRLPVKTHTVGKGHYGVFQFSFDITDVMRSVHPA